MSARPLAAALSALVLAVSLASHAPAGAATAAEGSASAAQVLKRTAVLTAADRVTGIPQPGTAPHERLVKAEFSVDLEDRVFFGSATIGGDYPGASPVAQWNLGRASGGSCQLLPGVFADTFPGTRYTNEREDLPAGWQNADCAVVTLFRPDGGTVSDQFIGRLQDERPRLRVRGVELLGAKKLGLVRGVWTTLNVEVGNAGPGEASLVVVKGSGKGLEVKAGRVAYSLSAEDTGTAQIKVRLTGKQRTTKLRLVASSNGARASRAFAVRASPRPRRPQPGSYRSSDGSVTFTISSGKPRVVGFRVRTQTQCGGYPDFPTYTFDIYDFPRVAISKAGIVQARDKGELYSVSLALLAKGRKVTRGKFTYSGPNRCFASESFTAKRAGR